MTTGLWQTLRCRDADAQIAFLRTIGFEEHAVHRDDDDPSNVVHAQMLWPNGGGIMLGSARRDSVWDVEPGSAATYLVADDPDDLHRRAVAAGASSIVEPRNPDYGGREASVRDPEGNFWSFGTYRPD